MAVVNIQDLEASAIKTAEVVDDDEFAETEEATLQQDMLDALSLLTRAMHLFAVMGDTQSLKTIGKRERVVMMNLSDQIKSFLDDVGEAYDPDGASEES